MYWCKGPFKHFNIIGSNQNLDKKGNYFQVEFVLSIQYKQGWKRRHHAEQGCKQWNAMIHEIIRNIIHCSIFSSIVSGLHASHWKSVYPKRNSEWQLA